jgi:hypothetical protein
MTERDRLIADVFARAGAKKVRVYGYCSDKAGCDLLKHPDALPDNFDRICAEGDTRWTSIPRRDDMADKGTCASCKAPILWVLTVNGRKMPLDAEPSERGNVHLLSDGRAEVLTKEHLETAKMHKQTLYTSHFATCVNAALHRRAKS